MIEQIYSSTTQNINWENVLNISEFKSLTSTFQSDKWFIETNVFKHIKLLTESMSKTIPITSSTDKEYRKIMLLSCLFLYIGKGATTFWNIEKKDWATINCNEVGEEITRQILWNDNPMIRESVCYFVRNYNKIGHILSSNMGIRELITISSDAIYPRYCNIENLIQILKCELKFMKYDYMSEMEEISFVYDLAKDIKCLTHPYEFHSFVEKYKYFNDSVDTYPKETTDKPEFEAFLTMGKPKSFDKTSVYPNPFRIIFNDDNNADFVDEVIECCENKINFALDLSSIPEEALDMLFTTIYYYQGKITFVYGSEKCEKYLSPTLSMEYINA